VIRIVTVCTANLCRSPLAEHVLRAAAAEVGLEAEVSSTGVSVRPGQRPPADWCTVVSEWGVDLAEHRSGLAELAAADLVVGMTARHLRDLAVAEPALVGRLVTLRGAVSRLGTPEAEGDAHGTAVDLGDADLAAVVRHCVGDQRARELLRADPGFDVEDPFRRPLREQQRIAAEIVSLARALVTGLAR
jgi:protein-tyrosine phosphatase